MKRITLNEIQEHPWYNKDLPLRSIESRQQIDFEIVKELFDLNFNISKSFEEVCQEILNKRNFDYCGAYELMKHDKMKRDNNKVLLKQKNETQ